VLLFQDLLGQSGLVKGLIDGTMRSVSNPSF